MSGKYTHNVLQFHVLQFHVQKFGPLFCHPAILSFIFVFCSFTCWDFDGLLFSHSAFSVKQSNSLTRCFLHGTKNLKLHYGHQLPLSGTNGVTVKCINMASHNSSIQSRSKCTLQNTECQLSHLEAGSQMSMHYGECLKHITTNHPELLFVAHQQLQMSYQLVENSYQSAENVYSQRMH